MKFEDYHIAPEIKRSLAQAGFKRPTDIQFKAIPAIMAGEDVLAIAQTGTGKTAAFAIPIIDALNHHYGRRGGNIRCLVMVPTRELAIQITDVFKKIAQYTPVQIMSVFGGVDQAPQISKLDKGVDIIVSTPGRMFDLVSQGHLKLNRLETLVLDEADHMLDLGFIKDIRDLVQLLPRQRQTLFFSATIDETIKKLAYSLVRNAIRIQVSPKNPVAKNITHSVAAIEMDDKRFFLERVIKEHPDKKILVFVRTKVRAERVLKALERVEIAAVTIHGDKEQADRLTAMKQFTSGQTRVLIATDVSARGIDIPDVHMVINYDIPEQPENYVHRVGRTGRGTQKGLAVSFCSSEEKPLLTAIEAYTGQSIAVTEITKDTYHETLDFSEEQSQDLKALMKEVEAFESRKKKGKK